MAERLGDLKWFALLREHDAIVRDQIARYGGFEVKTSGDAFMVAFGAPARPSCAPSAFRKSILRHGAEHPDRRVRVRIGLHAGEPVREGNDSTQERRVCLARRGATHPVGKSWCPR